MQKGYHRVYVFNSDAYSELKSLCLIDHNLQELGELLCENRLVGLVAKTTTSRADDLGSFPVCHMGILLGGAIPVTLKLTLLWIPCQVPGAMGLVLGSVHCDWVRLKVWSSISVWQCIQLPEHVAGMYSTKQTTMLHERQPWWPTCNLATLCVGGGAKIAQLVVCWAHYPVWCSVAGSILLWASGRGDFSLGVNMGSDSIPQKALTDRV